jgi:hypothetical protein
MRKDSVLLNYYYSKLPKKALGGGPDAPLRKGNSKGALNGYQLNQFKPGGVTTTQTTKPPYTFPSFTMPRQGNDSNSGLSRKQEMDTKVTSQKVNEANETIANFKKANPWAANLSDSDILTKAQMAQSAFQNQGTIKKAGPERSTASKAWAIASHPMTALKYKMHGQDVPDNFEKGETNVLDNAIDIINPASYINAGGRTINNLAHPLSTGQRLFNGARDLTYNLAGDNAGWNNVLDAAGMLGDAATFIPVARGFSAANKELKPFIKGAKQTYGLTGDLPFAKRFKNALNAGTTKYELPGIDNSNYVHHVFGPGMSSEQALAEIAKQKAGAPMGALMGDTNMSLNSTPLYFQSAARGAESFPVVRTGEFQGLNDWGFKGKKISQSIPQRVYTDYPNIIDEYNAGVNTANFERQARLDRIARDPSLTDAERLQFTNEADMMHKRDMGNIIPERQAMRYVNAEPGLFNEFATNYKPHLDAPIGTLNQRTGLNFPGTQYGVDEWGTPFWKAPTAFSVKGSFAPRYNAIAKKAGNAFLDNSAFNFKRLKNADDITNYENLQNNLNSSHNSLMNEAHRRLTTGQITGDEFNRLEDDIYRQYHQVRGGIDQVYPNGAPEKQFSNYSINPRDLNALGNINRQVNPNPDQSIDNRAYSNMGKAYNSILNTLKQTNPNHIFFK